MTRKLFLVSMVLIAAGLVLLLLSNPSLSLAFSNRTAPNFPSGGNQTAPNFPSGGMSGAMGVSSVNIIESLLGFGLVGVGLVLEAVATFMIKRKPTQATAQ